MVDSYLKSKLPEEIVNLIYEYDNPSYTFLRTKLENILREQIDYKIVKQIINNVFFYNSKYNLDILIELIKLIPHLYNKTSKKYYLSEYEKHYLENKISSGELKKLYGNLGNYVSRDITILSFISCGFIYKNLIYKDGYLRADILGKKIKYPEIIKDMKFLNEIHIVKKNVNNNLIDIYEKSLNKSKRDLKQLEILKKNSNKINKKIYSIIDKYDVLTHHSSKII
jgi:hypothetical protein